MSCQIIPKRKRSRLQEEVTLRLWNISANFISTEKYKNKSYDDFYKMLCKALKKHGLTETPMEIAGVK